MSDITQPQEVTTPKPRGAVGELLRRWRVLLLSSMFVIELAIFFVAMAIPVDSGTQQELLKQADEILGNASNPTPNQVFTLILGNNIRVALLEVVPVIGPIIFVLSIFTTGQVIQAVAISNGLPVGIYGLLLFIFPFALVELAAYATAVGSGAMLLIALIRRRLVRELRVLALELILVVSLLLAAAAMETAAILSPVLGILMWGPAAVAVIAVVVVASRRRSR